MRSGHGLQISLGEFSIALLSHGENAILPEKLMSESIQFPFNLLATIQTAGMWLNLYNRNLPWKYLTYVLYLSDRQHLIQYGSPITGDVYVCVKNKPNLLTVNELIHHRFFGNVLNQPGLLWKNYFTAPNDQGEVSLLKQAGDEELSSSIESVVQNLFDLYRNYRLLS